jgi:hypothetical protein
VTGLFAAFGVALALALVTNAPVAWAAGWRNASAAAVFVLGALAALMVLTPRLPVQNLFVCFLVFGSGTALFAAWAARSGLDAGGVSLGDAFGPKLLGLVPWPVPFLGALILLGSRAVARLVLLPVRRSKHYGLWLLGLSAGLATVVNLTLEPFASRAGWWHWPVATTALAWYGVSWLHFGIVLVLATAALAVATPWLLVKRPLPRPPDGRPMGLWAGLMLLLAAGNAREGAGLAAGLGAVVTAAIVVLAVRPWRGFKRPAAGAPAGPA